MTKAPIYWSYINHQVKKRKRQPNSLMCVFKSRATHGEAEKELKK